MARHILLLIGLVSGLALIAPVGAQESEADDPPERVARLSFIRGDVTFQAADSEAPEEGVINRPVTSGDRVMTGNDARAELTLGSAAIRLDARTDLSVANLDADIAHVEVNSGTISIALRALDADDTFQIDAPNGTVRMLEPGDYRVEVAQDGAALLEVRSGAAEIDSGAGPTRVANGQRARLGQSDRMATVLSLGPKDEFDRWSEDREDQLEGIEPARYVSRDMVGYEDLNERYGRWNSEPGYGFVWYPTVVAGWSPYTFGRWTWVSPWGWTWIDTAPWGFAPFHYGRWAHIRNRWCWVPGPRHRHPVYAPAHVAWVGHRDNFRGRPIGWYPLGPREVYVPGHRVSPRYLRNVNVANADIANNALITNVYRDRVRDLRHANRDVPGAFMTMPRDALASGQPVPNHGFRSSPGRVSGWSPPSGTPDVEPLRRFRIHSPAQPSASSATLRANERQWRSAPREWGQGVRTPETVTTPSDRQQRTYGTPLPRNERTYGNSNRSYGNSGTYGRPRAERADQQGSSNYGAPIRYRSPDRATAPAVAPAPRYTTPNTRGSDRPVSRQSYSSPPQPTSSRSVAPRPEASSGTRVERGGRMTRQPH